MTKLADTYAQNHSKWIENIILLTIVLWYDS